MPSLLTRLCEQFVRGAAAALVVGGPDVAKSGPVTINGSELVRAARIPLVDDNVSVTLDLASEALVSSSRLAAQWHLLRCGAC
jgi:hypothetical protein